MNKEVTKEHLNSIYDLFEKQNILKLSKEQSIKILNELNVYIQHDEIIEVNNTHVPKTILYFFDLINNYYHAYKLSKKEESTNRKNTLESQGKGNAKRRKKYTENEALIKDQSIHCVKRTLKLVS